MQSGALQSVMLSNVVLNVVMLSGVIINVITLMAWR
jgi:hypothetical protein